MTRFFFFRHTRFLLFHGAVERWMEGSAGSGNLIFTVILVSKLNFLHRVVAENGAQIMRFWKVFAGFVNFDFCESLFKSAGKSKFLSCQVGGGGIFDFYLHFTNNDTRDGWFRAFVYYATAKSIHPLCGMIQTNINKRYSTAAITLLFSIISFF